MLMDISEVLFNELVFLRVMQQSDSRYRLFFLPMFPAHSIDLVVCGRMEDQSPRLSSEEARGAGNGQGLGENASRVAESVSVQEPPNEMGQTIDSRGRAPKPLDPTLLQLLSASANLTLQEKEESLGKVMDLFEMLYVVD